MEISIVFDCLNAVAKERRKKVFNAHEFLVSCHSQEMTTTSATMTDIEHLVKFNVGETMTEDSVNTATINIVTDEEIARGLMSNTLSIIMSKMRGNFWVHK